MNELLSSIFATPATDGLDALLPAAGTTPLPLAPHSTTSARSTTSAPQSSTGRTLPGTVLTGAPTYTSLKEVGELPVTPKGQVQWPWQYLMPGEALMFRTEQHTLSKVQSAVAMFIYSAKRSLANGKRYKRTPLLDTYRTSEGLLIVCCAFIEPTQ